MARVLLFAMIGGGLVALVWLVGGLWLGRIRRAARARARDELERQLDQLAAAQPGGDPRQPLEISSPAVVEPKAGSMPCVRCGADVRVEEHQVRTVDGRRLRVARVRCAKCGHERELFFHLRSSQAN